MDANRRTTRWLLASFSAAFLPVVSASTVFVMPFIAFIGAAVAYGIYGPDLKTWMESLGPANGGSGAGLPGLDDLPRPYLMVIGALILLALGLVLVALTAVTSLLISRYGSRAVLRMAGARPVDPAAQPALVRIVENLSIGAGLPVPGIHLVESGAPNAFATGNDPRHASLALTRGLLALLDRRELEGVIAHELSHIGNHDIRLNTVLAALVGTMTIPFRIVAAPFRLAFRLHWALGVFGLYIAARFVVLIVAGVWFGVAELWREAFADEIPRALAWWSLHAMLAPLYALFAAPVAALFIRGGVSRQRELLADADAVLLTRDPEGLGLALAKIAAATGDGLPVGEGRVHMYFVDPLPPGASLLHRMFPSHPPVEERIRLLARMGNGIAPSALEAARQAGGQYRRTRPPGPPSRAEVLRGVQT